MFTEPFMVRALLSALLLGPLCGLLGVFVIARRMAFFSDTISHAALAGVALGFWWGLDPGWPMLLFSLLVAGGMMWLKENTQLLTDTIMALLLSGSVAFGIVLLSVLKGTPSLVHGYLFGDILAIGNQEVWMAAGLFLVIVPVLFFHLPPLTLVTVESDLAHVSGLRVRTWNYMFVLVLTLTVAVTIRLLGIILVTSLLVIPPAAARNLSGNLRQQLLFSMGLGLVGGISGTILSYQFDLPCGPTIVLSSIGLFFLSLPGGWLLRNLSTQTSNEKA